MYLILEAINYYYYYIVQPGKSRYYMECYLKRGSRKSLRQLMTINGKKRDVTEPLLSLQVLNLIVFINLGS